MRFACSVFAQRDLVPYHNSVIVKAKDETECRIKAMCFLVFKCPVDLGWEQHHVMSQTIDRDEIEFSEN